MKKLKMMTRAALGVGILGSAALFAAVPSGGGLKIANNTPKFTATAKNLGKVDPSQVIEVSIWLKPHNKADLDSKVKDLYNPKSPNYRHFLSKSEFAAKYAPTAEESKKVQGFFASKGLKVVSTGADNFYVRGRGTVEQVSNAFHVSFNNYQVKGKTVRANTGDPVVDGEAAQLTGSVAGLDTLEYTHPFAAAAPRIAPKSVSGSDSRAAFAKPAVSGSGTLPFDSKCFLGSGRTEVLTTEGSDPTATYKGNGYTKNPRGCGYTPENIQAAYGLTDLYKDGYDGKGQTIVILDWCGSPTITRDANAFSAQFGLPKLTSENFSIINTPGPSYCSAPDTEINIDVEWAHAIAPGAAIDLVVPPSATFQDVDQALFYAVNYQLGSVISGSYSSEELYTPETVLIAEDLISETAAVLGISANFSTGDSGDDTFDDPTDFTASVGAPADSPYATAVGGISLALKPDNSIAWQTGWGTNVNLLAAGGEIADPPANGGFFNGGSGGGESAFFYKPSYQSKLNGVGRLLPDISWLGDPFTGAYIAISEPFSVPELQYQVWGGTSVACPMFSALWAIANQVAGQPLGQAAPYLYSMPTGTITDVVPYTSKHNVTGSIVDANGTTAYSADSLAAPLEGTTSYFSALWEYPLNPGVVYLLTFGTDSGLQTAVGYDSATGLGVPNPKAFAESFKP